MNKDIELFKLDLQIKELFVRQEVLDDSIEEIINDGSQKDRFKIIENLEKERSTISLELQYMFSKVAQLEKISNDVCNDEDPSR